MSEIVERIRELAADPDPEASIVVTQNEAFDLVDLIDQLQHHEQ